MNPVSRLKKALPYVAALAVFVLITFFMFRPLFEGKSLKQQDVKQSRGMSKEIVDYRHDTGKEALWTNRAFSGMPAYQISMITHGNLLRNVHKLASLGFLPGPARTLFIGMVSFFILMLAFRVDPWISLVGAVAFALSSYEIINIEAGHNTKAAAIAYMPLVLAGFVLTFRGNRWIGASLAALAMGLQLYTNHPQIFYYTMIMLLVLGIAELVRAWNQRQLPAFAYRAGLFALALLLAAGANTTRLWTTYEYSKVSIRGGTELKNPDKEKKGGLDKDYALAWSYGKGETMTLLVPNFAGGSSMQALYKEGSRTLQALRQINFGKVQKENPQAAQAVMQNLGSYWGPQPFTSGPVYFGALVCFLFLFSLFVLRDNALRWGILAAVILSIMLAWGKNFEPLTNLFFDYFPLYKKFRTVSMILVIAQLLFPLLAALGLAELIHGRLDRKRALKALKIAGGVTGGILLLLVLFPGIAGIKTDADNVIYSALPQQADTLLNAIHADRARLVRIDALRSLVFVLLGAGGLFLYLKQKISRKIILALAGALILIDLWGVDKRFLNNDSYEKDFLEKALAPTGADMTILNAEYTLHPDLQPAFNEAVKARQEELKAENPRRYRHVAPRLSARELTDLKFKVLNMHTDFRVYNLSVSPFNDATTSYYHKSIGGYHGAKMQRYQELYDRWVIPVVNQASRSETGIDMLLNSPVLRMLNTKYLIFQASEQGVLPMSRHLGNAWFIRELLLVDGPDQALDTLGTLPLERVAVVEPPFADYLQGWTYQPDSTASITLSDYAPNRLIYQSRAATEQFAVFSEIYYNDHKGWKAYLDGKPVPHIRVNYVLRAMRIPAGEHTIEFRFEPGSYYKGEKISLAASVLILLLFFGVIGWKIRQCRMRPATEPEEAAE